LPAYTLCEFKPCAYLSIGGVGESVGAPLAMSVVVCDGEEIAASLTVAGELKKKSGSLWSLATASLAESP
jgi:hypothetical protein